VTIVVPVLITNCHVSLNLNIGPVMPQAKITRTARRNAAGWPVARDVHLENRENGDEELNTLASAFEFRFERDCAGGKQVRKLSVLPPARIVTL
jgi:hypothetical protein